MRMPIYNILKIKMTGTAHLNEEIDCQDAVANRANGNFACMVGADGAGHARYGKEGAELVANETLTLMTRFGTSFVDMQPADITALLRNNLLEKLNTEVQRLQCPLSDLASTLLFMATDGQRFVAGNLGDGMLGYTDRNDEAIMLIGQERGMYANMSWFVTSSDGFDHLRITKGSFDPEAVYFLMTDGTVDCLYNQHKGTFAPMLKTFCNWMRRFGYEQIHPYVNTAMHKYFPLNTTDDCALGLLTTRHK